MSSKTSDSARVHLSLTYGTVQGNASTLFPPKPEEALLQLGASLYVAAGAMLAQFQVATVKRILFSTRISILRPRRIENIHRTVALSPRPPLRFSGPLCPTSNARLPRALGAEEFVCSGRGRFLTIDTNPWTIHRTRLVAPLRATPADLPEVPVLPRLGPYSE